MFVFGCGNLYSQDYADKDYTIRFVSEKIESDLAMELISTDEAQTALNNLEYLIDNPININTASKEELAEIPILSDFQINQFIQYRTNIGGKFENIYDIKAIPSWDEETIRWIHPLLYIGEKRQNGNSIYNHIHNSRKTVYAIYSYDNVKRDSTIIGKPYAVTLKTSISNKNIFDFSIAAQKDKGEPTGNSIGYLMDSYNISLGIYGIKNLRIFLGDYRTSWGSGLVMSQNFNIKTYSSTTNINTNKGISTVKGATESNFSRGLAAEIKIGKTKLAIISSLQNMDGNVSKDSTITSFTQTGIHKTIQDLQKKDAVKMRMIGGNISFGIKDINLILSGIYYDWNNFKLKTPKGTSSIEELKNIKKMTNYSLSYIYHPAIKRIILSGEIASNTTKGLSTIHTMQYQNDKIGNISANIRYASPKYWSFYSSSQYYSSNNINNQWGYSFAFQPQIKIPSTTLSLVYDKYKAIRKRTGKSANNESSVYYVDITSKNLKNTTLNTSILYNNRYDKGNRIKYKLKAVISRNNIEYLGHIDFNAYKRNPDSNYSFGKMITLGLNMNKKEQLRLKTRLSLFDTDSFYNRIFHYYPRISGDYTPTFINGKGYRISLLGTSKINKYIRVEANAALEKIIDASPKIFIGISLRYQN